MSAGGYVRLRRRILESDVFRNEKTLKVFLWCLMRANYTARTVRFNGMDIQLRPGRFISGRFAGAGECHMKPSTFYYQLRILAKSGRIRLESDNKKTIFTVVNWEPYQVESKASGSRLAANRQQLGTDNKERKEEGDWHRRKDSNKDSISPFDCKRILKEQSGSPSHDA